MTELEDPSPLTRPEALRRLDAPATSTSLVAQGISRETLRAAVAARVLRAPFHGVVVPAHLPDTPEVRAAALALATSEHHVICDRTAAWLHGIDVFAHAELATPPLVETCALRWRTPTRLQGADGRTRDLMPVDIMVLHGVRVTTPLRTALDLGCQLRRREAMAALNSFAREHGVGAADMVATIQRFRGRRGVKQLRSLIPLVDSRIESHRESWVWLEIHDHGLPAPEPQYWIMVDGVPTYRLDFAYPAARVCIEYDGKEFHDRTPEQRDYDDARRRWLREHGWTVIVIRLGDFAAGSSDRWIGELREALRSPYSTRRF